MKRHINYYFLFISIILIVFGILFLANLSAPSSLQTFGNTSYYLFHQFYALIIGLFLGFLAFKIPLEFIKKIIPVIFLINLVLLVAVFLPFWGVKFWGAQRWINIGGNIFQPSEFLKITSVLYLASWLSKKFKDNQKKGLFVRVKSSYNNFIKFFLPFSLLLVTVSVILFFQKDLSTLAIVTAALLSVYFIAGTPLWHTIFAVLVQIASASVLIKIEPYRVQRLLVFLNPESDPLGKGFQLRQSLLAIGSGGLFGKGWGMSMQKFGILPQSMADSVFAILGEETGIIGSSILIALFLLFFWQGTKIARKSADKFSKMVTTGIMTWLILQVFMNISSSLGIWPLSGIPLPFFSYGGSHLIAEMIGVGLLLNISRNT